MKITDPPFITVFLALLSATSLHVALADGFTDDAPIKNFVHDQFDGSNAAIVIGLVDEHGARVFGAGKLNNGTTNQVDGDTVFFIGSVTKTFTALLFQEAADRGELNLEDPVSKFLPKSVTLPTHGGKEISLFNLATHTAGFPHDPDNMTGANTKEQFETYTVEKMYAWLSHTTLSRDPGTKYEYSNVGMSLLGHVLSLNAHTNFESLLISRICRPLHMDNTRIIPTPEMRSHLAMGHSRAGRLDPPFKLDAYIPAGAVHSTANDLLKYAAAQAGITTSSLTPSIEKTHVIHIRDSPDIPGRANKKDYGNIALAWMDRGEPEPGMQLLGHAGGAGSYTAWVGFDTRQHRGVVVLTTSDRYSVELLGQTLLRRRPFRENIVETPSELVGIGAALERDKTTRELRITKVLENTPASRAGLTAGLLIQKINDVPTATKTLEESVNLIRGTPGTAVRLQLFNPDRQTTNTITLTRQKVVIRG